MTVLPILHELSTAAKSVASLACGDPEGAGRVWVEYSDESVIGSTLAATGCAVTGNFKEAEKKIKGAGRATGHAAVGGGILPEAIPVFKELNKAGKALGDALTGDTQSARDRFTKELVEEYTDPKFFQNMGTAVAGAAVGAAVTFGTAGMGTVALIATNATASAATGTALNAIDQGIDIARGAKDSFDYKECIQTGIQSGIIAGVGTGAGQAMKSMKPNSSGAVSNTAAENAAVVSKWETKGMSGYGRQVARNLTGIAKPKQYVDAQYYADRCVNEVVKGAVKPEKSAPLKKKRCIDESANEVVTPEESAPLKKKPCINGKKMVTHVAIYGGDFVYSVRFTFDDGEERKFGGNGGTRKEYLHLESDEYIISVEGYNVANMFMGSRIKITTNRGRSIEYRGNHNDNNVCYYFKSSTPIIGIDVEHKDDAEASHEVKGIITI